MNDHDVTAPSNDDIVQDETLAMVTVPVSIDAPVRVIQLPSHGGGEIFLTVAPASTGAPIKVLNYDPMRRRASLLAYDNDVYVATSQPGCTASQAAPWSKTVPLEWTSPNELWMIGVTNAAKVSVVSERWTD